MLILYGSELLRIYSNGEERLLDVLYHPSHEKMYAAACFNRLLKAEFDGGEEDEDYDDMDMGIDFVPKSLYQDVSSGDGDNNLLLMTRDMYKDANAMKAAWEKYGKLVEPCMEWNEQTDA